MANLTCVVITPVRDEEQYLPLTIASMAAQTQPPKAWVIVNDGSKDRTGELIDAAAAKHPWIKAVHRKDRGSRQAGSGVIAAFYDGYALVANDDWDVVVKFDGDLSFGPDFFARCLNEFVLEPKLGIGGGTCCKPQPGEMITESPGEPPFHVRGPNKFYRRECFKQIGGLITAPGWDTVDHLKANLLGWATRTFADIRLIHHRPTGGAYGSWSNSMKNGVANYVTGYAPTFMAAKCLLRFLRGHFQDAVGLWCGFLKGYWKGIAQVPDPELIRYVRRQQWLALTGRKSLWR